MTQSRASSPLRVRSDLPLLGFLVGSMLSLLLWLALASAFWLIVRP